MKFARWVFWLAGIYGLVVLAPQYFLEERIGIDQPPPISHPEYFYGFIGIAIAWQIAFLIIGSNPARFRPMMLAAVVEKFSFGAAAVVLFMQKRMPGPLFAAAIVDIALGVLFAIAWYRVGNELGT